MSYRLAIPYHTGLAASLAETATEQIDRALAAIHDDGLDLDSTIHEVRRRCKKIRGILRLVRSEMEREGLYKRENRRFRNAGRLLSDFRDAKVLIDTYDRVVDRFEDQADGRAFAPIRARLTERRNALFEMDGGPEKALHAVSSMLTEGRGAVHDWPSLPPEYQPNQRMKTPMVTSGRLWPAITLGFRSR